jgi:hypothetical protein
LHPRRTTNGRGEFVFDVHPAKLLLRDDVVNKRHVGLRPSQLWSARDEYQEFDIPIFKQHIYHEIRRTKFINWMEMKPEEGEPWMASQSRLWAPVACRHVSTCTYPWRGSRTTWYIDNIPKYLLPYIQDSFPSYFIHTIQISAILAGTKNILFFITPIKYNHVFS